MLPYPPGRRSQRFSIIRFYRREDFFAAKRLQLSRRFLRPGRLLLGRVENTDIERTFLTTAFKFISMQKTLYIMKSIFAFLLVFGCFGAATLHAQNAALTVQGILKKADGSAVPDDVYTLFFAFYDAEAGGNKVWEEMINDVETTGGVYSVVLGVGTPLTAPFNVPYYLSVKIGSASAQELLPRPRLSAAPYALSLLGQDNVIPSTGNITVHGVTATNGITAGGNIAGYGLSASASLSVADESDLTKIVRAHNGILTNVGGPLSYGSNPTLFRGYGFLGDGGTGYGSNSGGVASIWAGGQNVINATNAEITMTKHVHITGSKTMSYTGAVGQLWSGGVATWSSFSNTAVSLETDKYIKTDGVFAVSDRRVKKGFTPSNAAHDLSQLMRLRVTDYQYKDVIGKGNSWKKGFIAQEVEEVVPEAINNDTGVIPDVYALAQNTRLDAGALRLTMEKPHDLKTGDKVRIMAGDHQEDLPVTAVASATEFSLGNWNQAAPEKVFVFGREVNDFHSVDYNHLFTMNISATQELARRVEALEKENADSKAENAELRRLIDGIRADVNVLKGQQR